MVSTWAFQVRGASSNLVHCSEGKLVLNSRWEEEVQLQKSYSGYYMALPMLKRGFDSLLLLYGDVEMVKSILLKKNNYSKQ